MTSAAGEVFTGGATTSQHVDAEDEDHFENTTFKLKRTRSMGLLDEFIQPTTPADGQPDAKESTPAQQDEPHRQAHPTPPPSDVDEQQPSHSLSLDTSAGSSSSGGGDHASSSSSSSNPDDTSHCVDALIEPLHVKSPEIIPHDDSDIQVEPSLHVDYLSHQWDVSDISKSWRYVIQKRRDVANSARLENASWRTWAQRRSNLKTISPEVVNWSKDSDVTWLYGPILKDDDHSDDDVENHKRVTTATSAVAGDISLPSKGPKKATGGPKPILKKRTVEASMISHSNLLKLQLATQRLNQQKEEQRLLHEQKRQKELEQQKEYEKTHKRKSSDLPPEFDDYDAISAKLNSQYINSRNNSNVSLRSMNSPKKSIAASSSSSTLTGLPASDNSAEVKDSLLNDKSNENINETDRNTHAVASGISTTSSTDSGVSSESAATPLTSAIATTATDSAKEDRHISFNDEVQQCIAVDEYTDEDEDEDYYDDSDEYDYDDGEGEDYIYEERGHHDASDEGENDDDDDDDDDDDEEGGFFLRVRSPSSASLTAGLPGFSMSSGNNTIPPAVPSTTTTSEDTASISTNNSKYRTIQMLPSTTLNHGSSDEESDEENPYTSSLSHYVNNNSSRGYDYHYDYNTVYTVDPNHVIYGTQNQKSAPDVVDVPENITMGSSFDYGDIEKDQSMPIIDPLVINSNNVNNKTQQQQQQQHEESKPVLEQPEPTHKIKSGIIFDDDSDSDDSDDGLSIGTKTSSHSLAQSVFGGMTGNDTGESNLPQYTMPQNKSFTNSRGDGSVVKQPTSSNSLSDSFFGSGFTKSKGSTSALSESFFNLNKAAGSAGSGSGNATTTSYNYNHNNNSNSPVHSGGSPAGNYSGDSPVPTQRKASPLPPQTTSANAFSGNSTPPQQTQPSKNTFLFDSGSDSEDEFVEDITTPAPAANSGNSTKSYATLSQVAGENGIRSPSPDVIIPDGSGASSGNSSNLVGSAKGLANHFLGSWKGSGSSNSSSGSGPDGKPRDQ